METKSSGTYIAGLVSTDQSVGLFEEGTLPLASSELNETWQCNVQYYGIVIPSGEGERMYHSFRESVQPNLNRSSVLPRHLDTV